MFSEQDKYSSITGIKTRNLKVFETTFGHLIFAQLILLTVIGGSQQVFATSIQLTSSDAAPSSGYFTLSWVTSSESNQFTLVQSLDQNFPENSNRTTKWDISSEQSFSMSGLNSGTYYYRIAEFNKPDDWSNTVEIVVKHHSLGKAYFIFNLGAALFLALFVIIFLNYKSKSRGF